MRAIWLVVVLANAACLRKTEFQCADDSSCGPAGRCESTNFCSFSDPGCSSGRRYDQSAGSLASQCTGGGGSSDGGTSDTSMMNDGPMVDLPAAACPGAYVAITGGQAGHVYSFVTNADGWTQQQAWCKATSTSADLAVPNDPTEHAAMDGIATGTSYWVGLTDSATEGTWLDVKGAVPTHLPWQPPAPDNNSGGPGEDCAESLIATHTLNDRRCNQTLPAMCECVPP